MSLPTDYPSGQAWIVTGQAHDQVIVDDTGRVITGAYVYFATGDGNRASIFVDDGHFQVRHIHPALHAKATLVDAVGRLTADTRVG